jgi:hypothetical protein
MSYIAGIVVLGCPVCYRTLVLLDGHLGPADHCLKRDLIIIVILIFIQLQNVIKLRLFSLKFGSSKVWQIERCSAVQHLNVPLLGRAA